MPKSVNRSCLIVTPAEGYVKWARALPDARGDEDPGGDDEFGTVYLIPEQFAGPEKWLRKNFKAIFENELEAWCLEKSWWPKHRGWDVFREFFDVKFTSVVVDLAREELAREAD